MKTLFLLLAVLMIFALVLPVAATTEQGIIQNGDSDSAVQIAGDANVQIDHANIKNAVTVVDQPIVNVNFPTPPPQASYLGVGDVSYTSLIYPGYIKVIPVQPNETIRIRAGTPVLIYTIQEIYKDTVHGKDATPVYDPVYDRLETGSAALVDWVPFYTTSARLTVTDADYLVIDNRNMFAGYNLVEFTITDGIQPVTQESQEVKVIEKPDMYPSDAYGHAITS